MAVKIAQSALPEGLRRLGVRNNQMANTLRIVRCADHQGDLQPDPDHPNDVMVQGGVERHLGGCVESVAMGENKKFTACNHQDGKKFWSWLRERHMYAIVALKAGLIPFFEVEWP